MILDNLSRALRTQNWIAAGVEFVIVITGVVIGFQINAWNEGRMERAGEREYLQRLQTDIELELISLGGARESHLARIGAIDHVLRASGRRDPVSEVRLSASGASQGTVGQTVAVPNGLEVTADDRPHLWTYIMYPRALSRRSVTFQELSQSGASQTFSDRDLLDAITRHYNLLANLNEFEDTYLRNLRDAVDQRGRMFGLSGFELIVYEEFVAIIVDADALDADLRSLRASSAIYLTLIGNAEQSAQELNLRLSEALAP